MLAARIALLREWLESGETAWLHVTGDSMWPFLPRGSRVQVCRVGDVHPGALIVYEIEDRLVCHRVLARRGARVLARGDAWRAVGAWVAAADVLGGVVAIDRHRRVVRLDTSLRRMQAAMLAAASFVIARAVGVARWLKHSHAGGSGWVSAA